MNKVTLWLVSVTVKNSEVTQNDATIVMSVQDNDGGIF